jgi:hypothetical protein
MMHVLPDGATHSFVAVILLLRLASVVLVVEEVLAQPISRSKGTQSASVHNMRGAGGRRRSLGRGVRFSCRSTLGRRMTAPDLRAACRSRAGGTSGARERGQVDRGARRGGGNARTHRASC